MKFQQSSALADPMNMHDKTSKTTKSFIEVVIL